MRQQDIELAKQIGRTLAKLRVDRGLTQEQVAVSLDVEPETISRFERGTVLAPLGRLMEMAELYQVPIEQVVRAGSTRPVDQANEITSLLTRLSGNDRAWVVGWVVEVCERLAKAR